jgi:hypothetical protein
VFLADELIERARAHACRKRRTIGALYLHVFCVLEEILHYGNYGAPVMQAIVPATHGRQNGIVCIPRRSLRNNLEIARCAS